MGLYCKIFGHLFMTKTIVSEEDKGWYMRQRWVHKISEFCMRCGKLNEEYYKHYGAKDEKEKDQKD